MVKRKKRNITQQKTEEDIQQQEENIKQQKDIEYYGALVDAFINTSLEKDRQLLTLSSMGIGFLISIIQKTTDNLSFGFWMASCIFFIITIISALTIFEKNKYYVENEIKGIDNTKNSNQLYTLDLAIYWSFILGIISLFVLSILLYVNQKEGC